MTATITYSHRLFTLIKILQNILTICRIYLMASCLSCFVSVIFLAVVGGIILYLIVLKILVICIWISLT